MSLKVGELFGELGLDDSPFNKKLAAAGESMKSAMVKAAKTAAVGTGAAIAGGVTYSLFEFSKLEKGMNEVFSLMPGISKEAMGKMTSDVQKLAVEMGITTDKIIPALYQSISAGVPPDNVFDFMRVASKASIGGVTDLETAVDGITSTINAYGTNVLSATQASDLMFTAVRMGKTTFDELAKSLFNVNPVAAALDVKFSDVTAALSAMTAQGVPTAVATTYLRQMLVELSKSGQQAADTFTQVAGKSFKDFIDSGGNVQGALQLLEDYAKKSGKGINDLFSSVEAGSAALTLTGKGTETFTKNLEEMAKSSGATDQAFQTMDQGISRSIDKIKANIQVLAQKGGELLAPLASRVAQEFDAALPHIQAFADTLSQIWSQNNMTFSMKVDASWDALYQLNTTVGQIADGVRALGGLAVGFAAGFIAAGAAIGYAFLNTVIVPIDETINAVMAGMDMIAGAEQKLGLISDATAQQFTSWHNATSEMVETDKGRAKAWGDAWDQATATSKAAFGDAFESLVRLMDPSKMDKAGEMRKAAKKTLDGYIAGLNGAAPNYNDAVTQIATTLITQFGVMPGQAQMLARQLVNNMSTEFNTGKPGVDGAAGGITNGVDGQLAPLPGIGLKYGAGAIGGLQGGMGSLHDPAVGTAGWIAAGVAAALNIDLTGRGQSIIQTLINGLGSMFGPLGTVAAGVAQIIYNHLPHSPAKLGPLSGKGSPFHSGISIANLLAGGMLSGSGIIRGAANRLAGSVQINPGFVGSPAFAGAGGALTSAGNVYNFNYTINAQDSEDAYRKMIRRMERDIRQNG